VTEWLAIAIGLATGAYLFFSVAKIALPPLVNGARKPELAIKLGFGGAAAAVLPAVLLSIVVGAPLGTPWGLLGMVGGVALVFALVLLAGVFAGVLVARYLA
jgi:hypothetical protein